MYFNKIYHTNLSTNMNYPFNLDDTAFPLCFPSFLMRQIGAHP